MAHDLLIIFQIFALLAAWCGWCWFYNTTATYVTGLIYWQILTPTHWMRNSETLVIAVILASVIALAVREDIKIPI